MVEDLYDHTRVTNDLTLTVVATGTVQTQAVLSALEHQPVHRTRSSRSRTDRRSWPRSPQPSNSFTMRYYYKTEPSFAWPGVASPPVAGQHRAVPAPDSIRTRVSSSATPPRKPPSRSRSSIARSGPCAIPRTVPNRCPHFSFSATFAGPQDRFAGRPRHADRPGSLPTIHRPGPDPSRPRAWCCTIRHARNSPTSMPRDSTPSPAGF